MKVARTLNRGAIATRGNRVERVRVPKGALNRVAVAQTESYGEDFEGLFGKNKTKKATKKANKLMKNNAKTDKKVRKKAAPTRKELKGAKKLSKVNKRDSKAAGKLAVKTGRGSKKEAAGRAKETKANAKLSLADQGLQDENKGKVIDTINNGIGVAGGIVGGILGAKKDLLSPGEEGAEGVAASEP